MRVSISGLSSWRKVGVFGCQEMNPFKEVRIDQCDIPWVPSARNISRFEKDVFLGES